MTYLSAIPLIIRCAPGPVIGWQGRRDRPTHCGSLCWTCARRSAHLLDLQCIEKLSRSAWRSQELFVHQSVASPTRPMPCPPTGLARELVRINFVSRPQILVKRQNLKAFFQGENETGFDFRNGFAAPCLHEESETSAIIDMNASSAVCLERGMCRAIPRYQHQPASF